VKLRLASSGGIGGLRLQGPLDTEELAPDLAAQARRLVEIAASEAAPEPPGAAGPLPDAVEYELTWFVEEEVGREVARHRTFAEATTSPAALDALRALMREVVRRRAAARRPS